jgi:hypothetical protein
MDAARPWVVTRRRGAHRIVAHRAVATSHAQPTLMLMACGETRRVGGSAGYDVPPEGIAPCAECRKSKGAGHYLQFHEFWQPLKESG